jgi:glycosyltransferase involved in cell wall biosynthesis
MVEELGLKKRVKFAGSLPRSQMRDVYLSAMMVVIFSTFREGTSLAALEAMSCGTPVVTSDIGGLKDLPSVKCDSSQLADKIIDTLVNAKLIGARQREWVVKNHDFGKWKAFWLKQISKYGRE